ncbi:hypothetical protein ABIB68_007212 [Bradyrhizobium sp. F1.2.2]
MMIIMMTSSSTISVRMIIAVPMIASTSTC